MTLVAALSGRDGTILFADTQETISDYSKKTIDKLAVWDAIGFRFGIAGATSHGTYTDMLQSSICEALWRLKKFDVRQMIECLTVILTDFYSKHVWPRAGERPEMQYLLVVQPHVAGFPQLFHICETAVNYLGESSMSIGIGSYLADYLFGQVLSECRGIESMSHLCAAGVHVAREVRENIEGVGQVDRIAVFGRDGQYDEVSAVDILTIEENLSGIREILGYVFADAMDAEETEEKLKLIPSDISGLVEDIRKTQREWFNQWKEKAHIRRRYIEAAKRKAGG